ncbi:hypothetical protein WICMUC_005900 [Wickerhamomyces mucosus]|uniref:SURP motif domain-containing protein n=1 Tax=Wickerhamomyces mucosus TaxID=1378264 RepID=A0A9P8P2F8_9ASCO|nr:hypothetical protein WICMUC_005900 [Wickerhamomyces mucosus]
MDSSDDIIIPPPNIKQIIDKTIKYIINNDDGDEFLNRLHQNNNNLNNNNNFNFINKDDLYHKYFQYKLNKDKPKQINLTPLNDLEFLIDDNNDSNKRIISNKDDEIIKLTALFITINGENSINLIQKNFKSLLNFKFLDDDNSYHLIFLKYLKQFDKLINQQDLNIYKDRDDLLLQSFNRAKFDEFNNHKSKIKSKEKSNYLDIDWNDFKILETIEFNEIDQIMELNKPINLIDLKFRTLEEKIKQTNILQKKQISNNEEEIKLIQCPITGKLIDELKFQSHLNILLKDPNLSKIKQNYESKFQNQIDISNEDIINNLNSILKKS